MCTEMSLITKKEVPNNIFITGNIENTFVSFSSVRNQSIWVTKITIMLCLLIILNNFKSSLCSDVNSENVKTGQQKTRIIDRKI